MFIMQSTVFGQVESVDTINQKGTPSTFLKLENNICYCYGII